ncbi:hypothetical protein ABEK41_27315, partial [Klebsiella pneumoniae]
MMSLWDALRMNMMISYQELVRTFPRYHGECLRDGDTSKQCLNAKITYEHIASEYEQDKKSRQ